MSKYKLISDKYQVPAGTIFEPNESNAKWVQTFNYYIAVKDGKVIMDFHPNLVENNKDFIKI